MLEGERHEVMQRVTEQEHEADGKLEAVKTYEAIVLAFDKTEAVEGEPK